MDELAVRTNPYLFTPHRAECQYRTVSSHSLNPGSDRWRGTMITQVIIVVAAEQADRVDVACPCVRR